MQNPKQIWGRDSEKEGSFLFSKMAMSIAETTRGERDKETHPCIRQALNGWQLYSPAGKQGLPMSVLGAGLAKLLKQVVSNRIARGEWGCRNEGTRVLLQKNSFSRHWFLKELLCPTRHFPSTEIKILLERCFLYANTYFQILDFLL